MNTAPTLSKPVALKVGAQPVPSCNFEDATRFLELLDPEGVFTFSTLPERPGCKLRPRVLHGTFDQHRETLEELNGGGAGVYLMVNAGDGITHEGRASCRAAESVVRVRAAFVDLDGAPIDPTLRTPVKPSIVVESSPGRWHVYWRLNGCNLADFKPAQSALAEKFNGDPAVVDLARLMRLPGFVHWKGDPFLSRLITSTNSEGK